MRYKSRADVSHLLAERYDTISNVKLDGFRPQLEASCVSSQSEDLWYNETVCLWMTIYIYMYKIKNNKQCSIVFNKTC